MDALRDIANRYLAGVPAGATPAQGVNGTLITSTTPQDILAAPGAGKSYYITQIIMTNPTAAETPVITIQDNTGTPVVFFSHQIGAVDTKKVTFDPPLKVGDNKKLCGKADSSVGDTLVFAQGFVADA